MIVKRGENMESGIEKSIQTRKQSIYDYYSVPENDKEKVEKVFWDMEQLGNECKDAMEFERKLAESFINQEYMDLFKVLKVKKSFVTKTMAQSYKTAMSDPETRRQAVKDDIKYAIDSATQPARVRANDAMMQELYGTPVVGDVIMASRGLGMMGRIIGKFKNRKNKKENDETMKDEF